MDPFPNSVLSRKEFFRKNLIDHHHRWEVLIILRTEKTPLQQRGFHDLQVVRINELMAGNGPIHIIVIGWLRPAFEPE